MKKILLFGGTTEGRVLAERLAGLDAALTVCVATPLGAEELSRLENIKVLSGRLDTEGIRALCRENDLCVDATHPYASLVTGNIAEACRETGTELLRLLRPESAERDGAFRVSSCAEAAAFLAATEGNILLTVGSKELGSFRGLDPERVFARVLPMHASLDACEALGLRHRNILALQGPFSQAMNIAMLEQYHISWMVTKDSGAEGGTPEKLSAARQAGARVILVARPADSGEDFETVLRKIKTMIGEQS